jgi:ubiquinone/menaquinone biosynthesis C-methylase UbiE
MHRLTGASELLDGPLDDPTALIANLRDLARMNRLTGGARLSERAIAAFGRVETILDVGTGGADIPMTLMAGAARRGSTLAVTATDSREEVLSAARAARPAIARTAGLDLAIADGRDLPYPDDSFDVGHASLLLHHLEPADAVAFLRELRRVSRRGIVVNDLLRGRLAWLGAWLVVQTVARSRYTRHDGPLSVRRAYSRAEMLALLAVAGLTPVATMDGFARHRIAIAAR